MIFTVAIDGPAAAGKGTISRRLADQFGFAHLDTGLLYRAVGAKVADGAAPEMAAQNLTAADLARTDLRSHAAGQAASKVAVIPEVRSALVTFQREFARQSGGAVLDGRDIGTVICPDADLKLFVTARPEVRAHRRYLELGGDEAQILNEIIERDSRDMSRADAPLRAAEDAVVIDTSDLDIEAAVRLAAEHVTARLKG
ncbi:MAG: (d)CMP kinase [Paracoccaceae bacterium]